MKASVNIGHLHCYIAAESATHFIYVLYPFDDIEAWAQQAARTLGITLVSITGMDWDDDLTPWPAPGAPTGSAPFRGLAADFLAYIQKNVIPAVEQSVLQKLAPDPKTDSTTTVTRDLIGVSLSGLFALWQWAVCDTFHSVASISGSFWYPGFAEWFAKNMHAPKQGKAWFCLGRQEPHTTVPQFRPVGTDTQSVLHTLQALHIPASFTWVPGNHYQDALPRLTLALRALAAR